MRKTSRAIGAAGSLLLLATTVAPVFGASHREAPLISTDAAADHTDVFAWVDGPVRTSTLAAEGTENRVNLAVNVSPMQDPAGGPNFWLFDPAVRYDIKIDNDRDARPDITYSFRFTTRVRNPNTFLYNTGQVTSRADADLSFFQTYDITKTKEGGSPVLIANDVYTAPINVGPRSTPNYDATAAASVKSLPYGVKAFAGQRDDPFFVDLGSIFDLGGLRPFNAFHRIPLAPAAGNDDLQANNVLTIALQVPIYHLTKGGKVYPKTDARATIGVWAANYRQSTTVINTNGTESRSGPWRQVSRMGNPLINEVVI
nr:DUF4331 domain-containing protein [Chloroflexota bacterium]